MSDTWSLNFWKSGEYQVIDERIDDLKASGLEICPLKRDMFRVPFRECSYDKVKVAILGQDPFPNPEHATGVAFSVPPELLRRNWPPTLLNVLKEYQDDLHYPEPSTGSLLKWCAEGVLLYNVIPSCTAYKSLSHLDWVEWYELTGEVIRKLGEKECLVVFLGGTARRFWNSNLRDDNCLFYSHPSPRANISSKNPFLGSRIFTTINTRLTAKGVSPIDWRL